MRPLALLLGIVVASVPASALEPIPDKLVVLTFDDASRSHFTVARPLLLKHKLGATFFVTEGWDFATNKKDYLTWEQIAQLHKDGFEIGNHTRDHASVTEKSLRDLSAQLKGIDDRCREHGIPKPTSFAYPGNAIHKDALAILKDRGIRFARRGGSPEYAYKDGKGIAYEPGLDHPQLVPTTGDARPTWTLDDLKRAVAEARHGKIAVLQFHGVPDTAHDWVSVKEEQFETFLKYLADEKCTVIAMRDLAKYVDADVAPNDPWGAIEDRKARIAAGKPLDDSRKVKDEDELRYWWNNAVRHHRFSPAEFGAALGLTTAEVTAANIRFVNEGVNKREQPNLLPYPGGRHPRIGFRDGMIRPQRETKASVFAPWPDGGYAVADTPEAVWFEPTPKKPELLYLAHTHIPTHWDRKKIELEPLEWSRKLDGSLELDRTLPNKVVLSSRIVPGKDGVRMEFRVTNGSPEKLAGLRVQMCVMLAGLKGFEDRTNANKVFEPPFAACKDKTGTKWIITGWERCGRAWGNAPCPCLHADPVVEDCPPGESRHVRGMISFFEGADIQGELKRVKANAFPAE
jgi:peptidoglycan/xylan/chitin deacetylase (PgdA/CDA1 family)